MEYKGIEYDLKFKVLMIGDQGVGKTSLIKTLVGQNCQAMLPTVGIDFVKKGFEIDGAKILLEVWDTAGQERFRSITKFQYRGTKGIVLVYDVTNKSTFETLNYWVESIDRDLDGNTTEPVPVFIVGNKIDLTDKRVISTEQGQAAADSNFVHGFMETSAKDNINVYDVFSKLAYSIVEIYEPTMLGAYKHLKEKKEREARRRRDYTRNAESIRLSHKDVPKNGKKHSCKCAKG